MKHKHDNMVECWENLSASERRYLCGIINRFDDRASYMHEGILPFFNRETAIRYLGLAADAQSATSERELRKINSILPKLGCSLDDYVEFEMALDDTKVRRYGNGKSDDSLIIKLEHRAMLPSGIRWQEFGKKYVKPEVNTSFHAQLTRINRNFWRVRVNKAASNAAKNELFSKMRAR